MNILDWDKADVEDFFEYNSSAFPLEDEQAKTYRVKDDVLEAEILVLPNRRVISFTIRTAEGAIVLDLSILAHAPLCRRRIGDTDCLYCHESTVLPGINAYKHWKWFQFYDYDIPCANAVSTVFFFRPAISLRFYDPSPSNRNIG